MSAHNTEFRRRAVAVLHALGSGAIDMPRIRNIVVDDPTKLHTVVSFLRRQNIIKTERKATGGKSARYRMLMTVEEAIERIMPPKLEMDVSALDECMPLPECIRETLARKGRLTTVMCEGDPQGRPKEYGGVAA